ncbi:hypothetical protein HanXRQr2_Chr01g0031181 [Helianthus annuus]|uniref:Uncharacterized protein n=1 Tax=Helianthus annuus TaxID=4232 RepID=A0A9K3JX40_HELAN|nr:hypothetical protein HanXRQr2_Chr01g0031181 [Helianthus annuus]KAJ0627593.1 hypothetical protein HanHA89_Chr01g0027541 [Helianthus annuus]KAJ0957680.1 hypothetical protein HanPSC8_Chr01g0030471 [Helianthus annuus]
MEPETPAHASVLERPEAQSRPGVQTGKHSSNLHYLNYVVVFDTLSGLDLGVKRTAAMTEEDQAIITQIMEKKRKLLSDTKHKLDTEAALDMSEEKRKLMGQLVGPAPSESEVDLSVFRKKSANILDDLYEDSTGKEGSDSSLLLTAFLLLLSLSFFYARASVTPGCICRVSEGYWFEVSTIDLSWFKAYCC